MLSGAVATHLAGTAAVFGLPQGVAPLTLTAAAAVGTKFGAGLLAATVAAMAAVSWAAKRLEARAPTAGALQKELQGAEVRTLLLSCTHTFPGSAVDVWGHLRHRTPCSSWAVMLLAPRAL